MGVEYHRKTGCSPKLPVITGKRFQKFLYALEHQRINSLLIHPDKFTQLSRQGEGQQVILGGKLFAKLVFDPLPPFMVLAVGATPVAA
jgi:hypothetical protein